MPIYEYKCDDGHVTESLVHCNPYREDVKIQNQLKCETCGKVSRRVEVYSFGFAVDKEYVSENIHPDGKPVLIKNRAHKKELMKKYGVHLNSQGMTI